MLAPGVASGNLTTRSRQAQLGGALRIDRVAFPAYILVFACAQARSSPSPSPPPSVTMEYVDVVAKCAAKDPPLPVGVSWHGEIRADYILDDHGALHDLRFDDFGDGAPEPVLHAIAEWLSSCKFEPPALNTGQASQFFEVGFHDAERLGAGTTRVYDAERLGAGMTPPVFACPTPKPPTPGEARRRGITGIVLVSYVVRADGRAMLVHLKNPDAPTVLFAAVHDWLRSCRFTPATQNGQPIAVKIVQPFIFRFQ